METNIPAQLTMPVPQVKQWQPRYPLTEIDERYVRDAERLRDALIPGLRLPDGASLSERARACAESYALYAGGESLQRDVRQLISRTLARAGGDRDWSRVELFLDDDYLRKPLPATMDFPEIVEAVARIGKTDGLSTGERDEIWKVIVGSYAQRLENGAVERRLKQQLREYVLRTVPFLAVSSDALSRAFHSKLKAWRESNRSAPDSEGQSFQSVGFLRIPKLTPADVAALRTLADQHGNNLPRAWREALRSDVLSEPVISYARKCCSPQLVPEWVRKAVRRKGTAGRKAQA